MINEKLVQQVREGKAIVVEGVLTPNGLDQLETVLHWVAPKDKNKPEGKGGFYMFDTMGEFWYREDYNPTSLAPIPLDDFFKGEDNEALYDAVGINSIPPPQSSLPSGVQTVEDVIYRWVKCDERVPGITKWYTIRNWITGRDAASVYCGSNDAIQKYCKHNKLDFPEYEWLEEIPTLSTPSLPPSEEKG